MELETYDGHGHRALHLRGCGWESCRIPGRRWSRRSRSVTWLPVCPSWVRHRWPIPRLRSSMAAPSPSSHSAPWNSRGRRRRRLWRRWSWSSWRRSLLRRRSCCLRCSGGTRMRGPGSLVRPGPRSLRRPACRSLVPGQRGGWKEERKEEEEEEEAEDVEDSPVSAPLLFVMSLAILSWVVSQRPFPMVQTVLRTLEIPQLQFVGRWISTSRLWVVSTAPVSGSHLFVAGLAGGVQYVDYSGK